MLINCPECGKEISDKVLKCVHCGYPIKEGVNIHVTKKFIYMCMSTSCLSNPFKEFDEYKGSTYTCPDCGRPLEYYETEIIDNNTDLVIERSVEKSEKNNQNIQFNNAPKCPKCGSTAITSSARGVNIVWGFIGASKTVNRCAICGHMWKPKK